MNRITKYILLFVLFGLLVLIRIFEVDLFYDPYLSFFRSDYLHMDFPRREGVKLAGFTSLRFLLNTTISLGILYVLFKDKSIIKFSSLVYGVAYLVLTTLFLYFIINPKQEDYYIFFNIRRFLIQPLILLLLIPAFYYYRIKR